MFMILKRVLPLVLSLSIIGTGCIFSPSNVKTAPDSQTSTDNIPAVALDIFSGRPNPKWALTSTEVNTLTAMIANLTPTQPVQIPNRLGYRGFIITLPSFKTEGNVTIRVYQTMVSVQSKEQSITYLDSAQEVETWLITEAENHISPSLYQATFAR